MSSAEGFKQTHLRVADASRITLVEQIAMQKRRVEAESAEYERLLDVLRETHDYGPITGEGVEIKIERNPRQNPARVAAAIEQYGADKVCKASFNAALARKVMPGAEVDALYDEGKKKVTVTLLPTV